MDKKFTFTYKNMSQEESMGHLASQWCCTGYHERQKTLTIGPNSKLSRTCQTTFVDDPVFESDSIDWNSILIVDLKIEAFITGVAQKALNKIIYNSNPKLLIQLHVGQSHETENGLIIQEAFDYFNQIEEWVWYRDERLNEVQKKIYLEYVIINQAQNYLIPLLNMKTDIFYDIEIHAHRELFKKNETVIEIEKWDSFRQRHIYFSNRQEM
jgi:hypothetical protein